VSETKQTSVDGKEIKHSLRPVKLLKFMQEKHSEREEKIRSTDD